MRRHATARAGGACARAGLRQARWLGLAMLAGALVVSGCGPASEGAGPHTGVRPGLGNDAPGQAPAVGRVSASPPMPTLAVAEHEARDLGPVAAATRLTLSLSLRERDQASLNALLAKGDRFTPAQWAARFGPSPAAVASVRRVLAAAGLASTWRRGELQLPVRGTVGPIDHFLGLRIDRFVMPDGTRFYAPRGAVKVPRTISGEVFDISGTNDYPDDMTADDTTLADEITAATYGPNGVTPGQMTTFYNMSPLRNAGFDGSGLTVMFPEWSVPPIADEQAFASKFGLPAFNVQVETSSAWGAPLGPSNSEYPLTAGEALLDVEVVHGLAPGAKEIVYAGGNANQLVAMLQAMVSAHPGAIMSSSVSNLDCELDQGAKADAQASDQVYAEADALGDSIYWAAGDRGAFACISDGNPSTEESLSIMPQAASPHLTAVGGTIAFLATNGAYYKEAAWGEPMEQWGGAGGISTIFPRPSWQIGPGTSGLTGRGIPDVSANADSISGWDVFAPGQNNAPLEQPIGGTSAAAPCWAAITSLIDEYLKKSSLKTIGFGNPAFYFFATDPSGMPAAPFHAITEGTNLHYQATSGWNAATGLGTPDVAHLADDFTWYDKDHGGSP